MSANQITVSNHPWDNGVPEPAYPMEWINKDNLLGQAINKDEVG